MRSLICTEIVLLQFARVVTLYFHWKFEASNCIVLMNSTSVALAPAFEANLPSSAEEAPRSSA